MALKKNPLPSPINKLVGTAVDAIRHPKETAEKAVEQAKGTAALGRMVAEGVVNQVAARTRGHQATTAPRAEAPQAHLTSVPVEKAETTTEKAAEKVTGVAKAAAEKAPVKKTAKKAPAKKAPAKKTAKKAPAPARPETPPVLATSAEPQIPEPLPADQVEPAEPELETIVAPTAEDLEAAHEASPADVAKKLAKKAPAKKAAKKAPAKKTAKKAPAKKAAKKVSPIDSSDLQGPGGTPDTETAPGPGDKLPPRTSAETPAPDPNPEASS